MLKQRFVYGTLKQGQRNHKYFKDSIVEIQEAYVYANIIKLDDYDCPTLVLEDTTNKVYGELITYEDINNEIEQSIINLEQDFNGLFYNEVELEVYYQDKSIKTNVFIYKDYQNIKHSDLDDKW